MFILKGRVSLLMIEKRKEDGTAQAAVRVLANTAFVQWHNKPSDGYCRPRKKLNLLIAIKYLREDVKTKKNAHLCCIKQYKHLPYLDPMQIFLSVIKQYTSEIWLMHGPPEILIVVPLFCGFQLLLICRSL